MSAVEDPQGIPHSDKDALNDFKEQSSETDKVRMTRAEKDAHHVAEGQIEVARVRMSRRTKDARQDMRVKKRESDCQKDNVAKEHAIIQRLAEVASTVETELAEVAKYEKESLLAQKKFKEDIDRIQAIDAERKILQLQSAASAQRADCMQDQLRTDDRMLCQLRDKLDELYTTKVTQENTINSRAKRDLLEKESRLKQTKSVDPETLEKRSITSNESPPYKFNDLTADSAPSSQVENLLQGLAMSLDNRRSALADKRDYNSPGTKHGKHNAKGGIHQKEEPADENDDIRKPAARQSGNTCARPNNVPKNNCATCDQNSLGGQSPNGYNNVQESPYQKKSSYQAEGGMGDGNRGGDRGQHNGLSGGQQRCSGSSCDNDKHPCKSADQVAKEEKEKEEYNKLIEEIYLEEARYEKGQEDRAKLNEAVIAENKRLDAITQKLTLIKEEMKHKQQDAVVAWQRVKCAQEKLAYHDEKLYQARMQLDALNAELTAVRAGAICARAKREKAIKRRYRKSLDELKDELWGTATLSDAFKEHLDSIAADLAATNMETDASADSPNISIQQFVNSHRPE